MKKHIVFITDCSDIAFNEIRAFAISELNNYPGNGVEIEPVVKIPPFSLINASFCLRLLAESYPEGTTFCVIVNPVKNRPERICGKTKYKKFNFVGANTGVFDWFLNDFEIEEIVEISDPGFVPFGGKFIHAPTAAKLAVNVPLFDIGQNFNINKLNKLPLKTGTIVHIDNFGLIKFLGKVPDNLKDGDNINICINNQFINGIYSTRMMNRDDGEWVLYPGSSLNLPEIGKVRSNGAKDINASIGDIIQIEL